jgi:molybdopterin converting factor small subunit
MPGLLDGSGRSPRRRSAAADPVVRGGVRRSYFRAVRPRESGVSTVFIPTVLRPSVGGNKQVELGGESVGDLVTALVEQYPSLRPQLLTDDGDLNRFVNVYVNGQDVRYLDGLKTPVGERDEVRLLPAMAGG